MRRTATLATALALALGLAAPAAAPARLNVKGAVLRDGTRPLRLLGVNRSGAEYMCLDGYGDVFDGPHDQASVTAMKSWAINAVRLPLNESCWLGSDGVRQAGAHYRRAIGAYVALLRRNGLRVILDSHVASAGGAPARAILPMADAGRAPAFWRSLARTFRKHGGVLFDLYNEPNNIGWACWRNGCTIPAGRLPGDDGGASYPAYRAAGMAALVRAVRSTGARQPIMVGGVDWSLDVSGWWRHRPHDPLHALVASFHTYGPADDQGAAPCLAACRDVVVGLARHVPVVAGELGEYDCAHGYIDGLLPFLDAHGISYLGWTWDAVAPGGWQCGSGPSLIASYDGTPTAFGVGLRDHLRGLAGAG